MSRTQVRIRGRLDRQARLTALPIAPTAPPAGSVGCICWIRIGRHLDRVADAVGLSIALITRPPGPIAFCARILGYIDSVGLGKHIAWDNCQKRKKNHGMNGHGVWSLY